MHDRIEHLIEKQVSRGGHSSRARSKSEYVSRYVGSTFPPARPLSSFLCRPVSHPGLHALLEAQFPPKLLWLNNPFLCCSKRLTGPKPLPLIRVVET